MSTAMSKGRRSAIDSAAMVMGALTVVLGVWQWWNESMARQDPTLSGEAPGDWMQQWAVTTHVIPTLVLLVALALAWRWPLVGAVVFLGFVVLVLFQVAPEFGYVVFALPHLIVGVLFLVVWLAGRRPSAAAHAGA